MNDKEKALEQAILQIEKQFGKGSIMKLGDVKASDVEVISTGCLTLDMALGIGGIPRGRIIEIYGPESSGKTTVSLHMIAEAQKAGGTAAFIDVNTHLTQFMPLVLELIQKIFMFHNQTPASKVLKLLKV